MINLKSDKTAITEKDILDFINILEKVSMEYKVDTTQYIMFCRICGEVHVFDSKTKKACRDDMQLRMRV